LIDNYSSATMQNDISDAVSRKRKRGGINDPRTLKYLHITKCGGTTIEDLSEKTYDWGRFDTDLRDAASEVPVADGSFWHVPPRFFLKQYLKPMIKSSDFFMSVINPFTRVISEYHCKWGGPKQKHSSVSEFNEWIRSQLLDVERRIANSIASNVPVHSHWIPQYLYLMDRDNIRIVPPLNVVHFENFDDEFETLMQRYQITDVTTRNRPHSLRREVKEFHVKDLSDENLQLIRRIYEKDFTLFGYRIDDPFTDEYSHENK